MLHTGYSQSNTHEITRRIASADLLPKSRCVHQTAVTEMTVAAGESMRESRKDPHSYCPVMRERAEFRAMVG